MPRGEESFIYGDMSIDQKKLVINSDLYVGTESSSTLRSAYSSAWNTFSDIKLKENIKKIDGNILKKINQLNPVLFDWKKNKKNDVGFIAQELKKVFPLLISNTHNNVLSIDYCKLSTYLVKGMQEQNNKIQHLEEKIKKEKEERIKLEDYFKKEKEERIKLEDYFKKEIEHLKNIILQKI